MKVIKNESIKKYVKILRGIVRMDKKAIQLPVQNKRDIVNGIVSAMGGS